MPTCVLFNPAARSQQAAGLIRQLRHVSKDCQLRPTAGPGDARRLAGEAAREGFDTVVAAGGDGTLQEVVSGLGEEPGALDRVRLGVLPMGTINVFARGLDIPLDLAAAWKVIQEGHVTAMDLPFAECRHPHESRRHYFTQLGGAGLDSRAIGRVDWTRKKALGPAAYLMAGFQAMTQPQSMIRVTSEHGMLTGQWVLIGNGRHYGGPVVLFPKADMRDGLLDVLVFPRIDWESLFELGYGCLTNQILNATGACYFQTASFTLASSVPTPLQLDGDNIGWLPAAFSVRPRALRVLTPAPFFL